MGEDKKTSEPVVPKRKGQTDEEIKDNDLKDVAGGGAGTSVSPEIPGDGLVSCC